MTTRAYKDMWEKEATRLHKTLIQYPEFDGVDLHEIGYAGITDRMCSICARTLKTEPQHRFIHRFHKMISDRPKTFDGIAITLIHRLRPRPSM